MAHSSTGYTTNLPLADVTDGKAWVVWEYGGKPLPREHGGPVRLLVPHLYFWKSAKWVSRLELMAQRPARLLGAERLPRPRRPLARAALPGRLRGWRCPSRTCARSRPPGPTGTGSSRRTSRRPRTVRLRMHVEGRHRAPAGPALPGPAARARRLHGPAVLLDRLRRRRPAGRAPRRAAARRRGLGVPRRRRRGRRRAGDARPDRPLVHLGHPDPGTVPGRRHRRRPRRLDAAHRPPARPRRAAAGRRRRARSPTSSPTPTSSPRRRATIAYTRDDHRRATRRRRRRPPSSAPCSRARSWPTSAARPASRRTPRRCCSSAGWTPRRDPGGAVRPDRLT